MNFKERNPEFFIKKPFWPCTNQEMVDLSEKFDIEYHQIGKSAGNRPIYAMYMGEKEEIPQKTTLNGALSGGHPEDFFRSRDKKQVLAIISSIHGVEVEGCVTLGNLFSVAATGEDLKGKDWPRLQKELKKYRLVIVPIGNPDGRARSKINTLKGATDEDVNFYNQGLKKDGSILGWPECFRRLPVPVDEMEYLGGYYNDDGYTLSSCDPFVGAGTPEMKAFFDLFRAERPDCYLEFHSCGAGPFFLNCRNSIPSSYQQKNSQIRAAVASRHLQEGLRPRVLRARKPSDKFGLQSYVTQIAGSLPLLFEFPNGQKHNPYKLEEIVDVGLFLLEELLVFGSRFRFRPDWN